MRFNLGKTSESKTIQEGTPESIQSFLESSDKIDEAMRQYQIQINLLQAKFRDEFTSISSSFFEAVPSIKSITWSQYTPYFSDGDECIFSVNSIEFASDENEDQETYRDFSDEDEFSCELYSLKNKNKLSPEQITLCEKMEEIIQSNDNLMKDIFGDHVLVILTKGASNVSDYKHD
jgi:hypothetical protein